MHPLYLLVAAALIGGVVVAICKLVFGIVAVLSVPPEQRVAQVREVGKAWRGMTPKPVVTMLSLGSGRGRRASDQ